MQDIKYLLKLPTEEKTEARSEREDLMRKFLEKLNKDRGTDTKYKPISAPRFNSIMKNCGLDLQGMYWLYNECSSGDNFNALFWWNTKYRK